MYPKHTNTPEDSCSLQAGQRLPYPCWVLPCHPSEHFPSGKQERRRISSTTTLLPNHFFRGRLQRVETMKLTPVTLAISPSGNRDEYTTEWEKNDCMGLCTHRCQWVGGGQQTSTRKNPCHCICWRQKRQSFCLIRNNSYTKNTPALNTNKKVGIQDTQKRERKKKKRRRTKKSTKIKTSY